MHEHLWKLYFLAIFIIWQCEPLFCTNTCTRYSNLFEYFNTIFTQNMKNSWTTLHFCFFSSIVYFVHYILFAMLSFKAVYQHFIFTNSAWNVFLCVRFLLLLYMTVLYWLATRANLRTIICWACAQVINNYLTQDSFLRSFAVENHPLVSKHMA